MENLSFEQRIAMLALAKSPKEKAELITKFSNNREFYASINRRNIPLDKYMELHKEEFAAVAARAKRIRDGINNKGWTKEKYQKYTGEIPERLLLERPEFSATLPRKKLGENIRLFLKMYPQFSVDK
jgi:hypothetical protein